MNIKQELLKYNIPYKVYGGFKFFDRKEIKDAIAYLKLIHNVDDSQSLRRIINVPKRAIGETTLKHLQEYADENDISLFSAILNVEEISTIKSGTASKLKDFTTLIMKFQEAQSRYQLPESDDIVELLDLIGKKIGAFRNGETDYDKVYQVVMKDLKDGYLGQVTFDWRDE